MKFVSRLLLGLALFTPAALFAADPLLDPIIIGNLSLRTPGDDNGNSGNGSIITYGSPPNPYGSKAVGFTMGSVAYDLTAVTLQLKNVTGTTDAPLVEIYTKGASSPGSLVGALVNPTFNGAASTAYTFTPAASITLNANASYYIVVRQTNTVGSDLSFSWLFGNTSVTPVSSVGAVGAGTLYGMSNSSSISQINQASPNYTWFQINGVISAVPEPSTYALLVGFAGLGLVVVRRVRSRRN